MYLVYQDTREMRLVLGAETALLEVALGPMGPASLVLAAVLVVVRHSALDSSERRYLQLESLAPSD